MSSKVSNRLRLRRNYSKFEKPKEIPNLIQIQSASFEKFLQAELSTDQRSDFGLQAVFKSVFPIRDYNDTASLEFVSYEVGEPKYDMFECQERGMTWAAPLKVTVQLVLWDTSAEGGRQIRDIKEQEVYFGEIPLMTQHGTFMVNGSERVIVSQLHRSPGVFFDHDRGKTHSSGKILYNARVIPYRGSWLDLEFDVKDILHVRIDRRRKQHATILLRALGMSAEEILNYFYKSDTISFNDDGSLKKVFNAEQLEGQKAYTDVKVKGGKVLVKAGQKFNRANLRRLKEAEVEDIDIDPQSLESAVSSKTIVQALEGITTPGGKKVLVKEGEVLVGWDAINKVLPKNLSEISEKDLAEIFAKFKVIIRSGEAFTPDQVDSKGRIKEEGTLAELKELGLEEIEVLYLRENHIGDTLLKTLDADGLEPDKDDILSVYLGRPQRDALIEKKSWS
jgi:DNA-directed RNA polymerase subunit beta